jgi:LysM repeat protein
LSSLRSLRAQKQGVILCARGADMSPKKLSLIALATLLPLALVSCVRSASTPPAATATQVAGGPTGTQDPLELLALGGTQTVLAAQGTFAPTNTPNPGQATQTAIAIQEGVFLPTATPPGGTPGVGTPVAATPVPFGPTYTPPPLVKPQTYTLQKGEFPYCIARRFNVNPNELMTLNGLTANSLYEPGMTLQIPQTSNTFPGERALLTHPATYTVVSGDTIYGIACKYGDVYPEAIGAANGIQPPFTVSAGQTLQIP